jgi:hypothetical protein
VFFAGLDVVALHLGQHLFPDGFERLQFSGPLSVETDDVVPERGQNGFADVALLLQREGA